MKTEEIVINNPPLRLKLYRRKAGDEENWRGKSLDILCPSHYLSSIRESRERESVGKWKHPSERAGSITREEE